MSNGFAGCSHSCTDLQAVMESIAVLPEPPAPYNTKGLLEGPGKQEVLIAREPMAPCSAVQFIIITRDVVLQLFQFVNPAVKHSHRVVACVQVLKNLGDNFSLCFILL